jgi:hypothetical protein
MAKTSPKDRGLGRLVEHDPRSRLFRALTLAPTEELVTRTWRRGWAYDQGSTSQCVAYTGKGIMNTGPLSATVPYDVRSRYDPAGWYAAAQMYDEWPGTDYDGTSALGLCKALKVLGLLSEYRWCFGLEDVLVTLSHVGPVGIGVGWRTGMWDTDSSGFIRATGADIGGHEVELIGISVPGKYVVGVNSWGTSWGSGGRFKLSWLDLGVLLADQGDAVVLLG